MAAERVTIAHGQLSPVEDASAIVVLWFFPKSGMLNSALQESETRSYQICPPEGVSLQSQPHFQVTPTTHFSILSKIRMIYPDSGPRHSVQEVASAYQARILSHVSSFLGPRTPSILMDALVLTGRFLPYPPKMVVCLNRGTPT